MDNLEKISYAKTVYGKEEVDAVVKCLTESTQMGNYSRKFETEIAKIFEKTTKSKRKTKKHKKTETTTENSVKKNVFLRDFSFVFLCLDPSLGPIILANFGF